MSSPRFVPPTWERWVEFQDDGEFLNLTGLSNDAAIDLVRVEVRKGRRLKNTFHKVKSDEVKFKLRVTTP